MLDGRFIDNFPFNDKILTRHCFRATGSEIGQTSCGLGSGAPAVKWQKMPIINNKQVASDANFIVQFHKLTQLNCDYAVLFIDFSKFFRHNQVNTNCNHNNNNTVCLFGLLVLFSE